MKSDQNPLLASLSRLGVPVSPRQWLAIAAGAVVGLIVARFLALAPVMFLYTSIIGPIQDVILGPEVDAFRDGVNSAFFTGCTCLSSFLVAFVISLAGKRGKRG